MDLASSPSGGPAAPRHARLTGALLFLFIPLVLFHYVQHPAPVGLSLAAGVILMLGHRRLARPYMLRVLAWKCVWCNRLLPPAGTAGTADLELLSGGGVLHARCCAAHRDPAARFFTFLNAWRWPLRLGIFVPLLLLLAALATTALGRPVPLDGATNLFRLAIGVTVNVAAWGYLLVRERAPLAVPFPVHNFFLLGVRSLLWIFRLVGIWWIALGGAGLAALVR